ncbi:MAG: hypothetical protein ACE15D_14875, partial [Candidatus Eisenbacteria bacterium]
MSLEIIPFLVPCLFETDTPAETMDGAPAGWWRSIVLDRAARASPLEVPDEEALQRLSALRTQIRDAIDVTVEERIAIGAELAGLRDPCDRWPPFYIATGDLLASANTPNYDASSRTFRRALDLEPTNLTALCRDLDARLDKMRFCYDRYGLAGALAEARAGIASALAPFSIEGAPLSLPPLPLRSRDDATLSSLVNDVGLPLRYPLPGFGSDEAHELAARLGLGSETLEEHFDSYARLLFLTAELLAIERTDPKIAEDRIRFQNSAAEGLCYVTALLNTGFSRTEILLLKCICHSDLGDLEAADMAMRLALWRMPGNLQPFFALPAYSGRIQGWWDAYRTGERERADSLANSYWRAIDPDPLNPTRISYWRNVSYAVLLAHNPQGAWLEDPSPEGPRFVRFVLNHLSSATGQTISLMGPPSTGFHVGVGLDFVDQVLCYPGGRQVRTQSHQAPNQPPESFAGDGARAFAELLADEARNYRNAAERGLAAVPLYVHSSPDDDSLRVYGFLSATEREIGGAMVTVRLKDATGRTAMRSWSRTITDADFLEITPQFAPGVRAPVLACNFGAPAGHYQLEVSVVREGEQLAGYRSGVHFRNVEPGELRITGLEAAVQGSFGGGGYQRPAKGFKGRRFMPAPALVPVVYGASRAATAGASGPVAYVGVASSQLSFCFEIHGLEPRRHALRWRLDYFVVEESVFLDALTRASAGRLRYEPPEDLLERIDFSDDV